MKVDTAAKELLFSTVRLTGSLGDGTSSTGTGFLLDADPRPDRSTPFLVTNKHVIEDAGEVEFDFFRSDDAGDVLLSQRVRVCVSNGEEAFIGHPNSSVDVCASPLGRILQSTSERLFFRTIPTQLMPDSKSVARLDAIEDVTFVGYPDGRQDPLNGTPITRRGITATPIELDFAGRPVFLVDASVFSGSSGSPVFIFDSGGFMVGGKFAVGQRMLLVGMLAETMTRNTEIPMFINKGPFSVFAQELNLGVAFNWRAIDETIDEVFRQAGLSRPGPIESST